MFNCDFRDKLKSLVKSYVSDANAICGNKQNQFLHRTLKGLSLNKSIKVCRYDKSKDTVVFDSSDYFKKLDSIILDETKFQEVRVVSDDDHPIIKNEDKIKSFLYRNIKSYIDEEVYDDISPSGSQPGKLYGLCKVHKNGNPMRPVISMIGTAEYKLAKYLDEFIKPNINVRHSVDSTSAFMDKLKVFEFKEGDKLVSFDVCSLFTNVPLDETIGLISDCVYGNESKKVPPFPKKWFTKLLKFATSGMFLYNNRIYKQVDGVAMGSPLGPSLANFFLGYLERTIFNNAESCVWGSINPKMYIRYVDDIFAVFDNNTPVDSFLEHLNSQHPNIKFTIEEGTTSLPFLDTEIRITGDDFESWTYRKKTDTGVILNSSAVCPNNWKKGLILGALNRAKVICSSSEHLANEIEKLKTIFWNNGYSKSFFDRVVESFNNSGQLTQVVNSDNFDGNYFVKIPYFGPSSHIFKSKIISLFNTYLFTSITPVFSSFKVSNYFSLKSQTPRILTSNVVYKFTCLCDTNLTYIGKTKRHLVVRKSEHLEFESKEPKSEIKEHLKKCLVCRGANIDNFEIIKKCKSDFDTKVNEALFIRKENPSLNKNLFNSGSLYTLKVYS